MLISVGKLKTLSNLLIANLQDVAVPASTMELFCLRGTTKSCSKAP